MHTPLLFAGLILFASMFLPLPSPVGAALSLWALGEGLPVTAVLTLYVAQDVITYAAIQKVLPRLQRRFGGTASSWLTSAPAPVKRPLVVLAGTGNSQGGLLCAALASFYAGAALAALRHDSPLRSAAIVIGVDVVRFGNGLALAVGAAAVLPSSTATTALASLAGLAVVLILRLLSTHHRRPALVPIAHL